MRLSLPKPAKPAGRWRRSMPSPTAVTPINPGGRRARTLHRAGDAAAAQNAVTRAAALVTDPAVRRWLLSGALFD